MTAGPIIYVVQAFSRNASGLIVTDAPVWSRDQDFAEELSAALSKRKAGVITLRIRYGPEGELAGEAEIVGGCGSIPTELILPPARPVGPRIRRIDFE
jgi:hypothetical protein